jgi:hypothetical protein
MGWRGQLGSGLTLPQKTTCLASLRRPYLVRQGVSITVMFFLLCSVCANADPNQGLRLPFYYNNFVIKCIMHFVSKEIIRCKTYNCSKIASLSAACRLPLSSISQELRSRPEHSDQNSQTLLWVLYCNECLENKNHKKYIYVKNLCHTGGELFKIVWQRSSKNVNKLKKNYKKTQK